MGEFVDVILLSFFGFCALAAALLIPVYRFLKREEAAGEAFTRKVSREAARQDGMSNPPEGDSGEEAV